MYPKWYSIVYLPLKRSFKGSIRVPYGFRSNVGYSRAYVPKYILRPRSSYIGTTSRPKCILFGHMNPYYMNSVNALDTARAKEADTALSQYS